ncbi:NAD dependent epimerase [Fragilaria crotonensis]|nr:NAD dependent epimerase [Fragilaria crotonensis]
MRLALSLFALATCAAVASAYTQPSSVRSVPANAVATMSFTSNKKGKLLVLGGTGFLGQTVCKRAILEGYQVTSLSRRGRAADDTELSSSSPIDYRNGDAREKETISKILDEGGYTGVIHCIGLLFDDASGLGQFNVLVSGSGSLPDTNSTYDTITRLTAFNAIDASVEYAKGMTKPSVLLYFCRGSWLAGYAGRPQIEKYLAPEWLRRYLVAKRVVEKKLLDMEPTLRPIIVRPSLIYSLDRPQAYLPVGAFFLGNAVGLPFVDRPVTVQALACAMVRAMDRDNVSGVQRYTDIDQLNQ